MAPPALPHRERHGLAARPYLPLPPLLPLPLWIAIVLVLVLLFACRREETGVAAEPPGAPPAAAAPGEIAGTWRVEGQTTVVGHDDQTRAIEGTIVLVQRGDRYTASYELETVYPDPEGGALPAQVLGKGEGTIAGSSLAGTAHTQIVASRIPGIDSRFGLVPPSVGTRIVSSAKGSLQPDGSLRIEIESQPEQGQIYIPTRTSLRGVRVGSAPAPQALPPS